MDSESVMPSNQLEETVQRRSSQVENHNYQN